MALILIVDDSPTELHVMQKALEKHGFRTAAAADGAEGVRLAREMSPDLIFMDIVMPGMNGYQATRALANDPRTRTDQARVARSAGRQGAGDPVGVTGARPTHDRAVRAT
ncbi:MAG: response regulator [Gammaproteobacteria bacterium]|nr:MAG: response regulator [Gammaproteobacteria bacterium]